MLKKSASGVLASLRGSTSLGSRNHWGAFSFAKTHYKGERPTRSAVCTSSPLRSLRLCLRNGASWRAGAGWVRTAAFLSILRAVLAPAPFLQSQWHLSTNSVFPQPA